MLLYVSLIFVVINIVGFIGNFFVLLVIFVNRQLHDSTNLLICNLALADLLFLTLCVPITAYSYIYSWVFSETICYITVTLQYMTCYVSVWTLVLLSYDRYSSVTNPVVCRNIRRKNCVIYVCIAVWLLIFALNLPQMHDVGVLSFEYNGTIKMACVDSLSIATETSTVLRARIFYWGFNLVAYVLPLALSTFFYFLLVRAIWKQKAVQSKSTEKVKRHATKMVFIVILTFGVCWLPQNARFFLRGLNYPHLTFWEKNAKLLLLLQSTAQVIAYANSCVNPILYSALSERFRVGLFFAWNRFFACKKSKNLPKYVEWCSLSKQTFYNKNKLLKTNLKPLLPKNKNQGSSVVYAIKNSTSNQLNENIENNNTNFLLTNELSSQATNDQFNIIKNDLINKTNSINQTILNKNKNENKKNLNLINNLHNNNLIEKNNNFVNSIKIPLKNLSILVNKKIFINSTDNKNFNKNIIINSQLKKTLSHSSSLLSFSASKKSQLMLITTKYSLDNSNTNYTTFTMPKLLPENDMIIL